MTDPICGYLVLRLPEHCSDGIARRRCHRHGEPIGGRLYGGIDRMPWFDVIVSTVLPPELSSLRAELIDHNAGDRDILITPSLDTARQLLRFANSHARLNELCAVYSEGLAAKKGSFAPAAGLEWLGTDLFVPGYGSILDQGFFEHPTCFSDFDAEINVNGVLSLSSRAIDAYIERYVELTPTLDLEPIDESRASVQRIDLARVLSS